MGLAAWAHLCRTKQVRPSITLPPIKVSSALSFISASILPLSYSALELNSKKPWSEWDIWTWCNIFFFFSGANYNNEAMHSHVRTHFCQKCLWSTGWKRLAGLKTRRMPTGSALTSQTTDKPPWQQTGIGCLGLDAEIFPDKENYIVPVCFRSMKNSFGPSSITIPLTNQRE